MPNADLTCPNCGHDLAPGVSALLQSARTILETIERHGVFVGSSSNRGIKHFHHLTCKWAAEIPSHNLVVFQSHDQAVAAGYRVCKNLLSVIAG